LTSSGIARCYAAVLNGIEAVNIDVEVDIGRGLPGIKLVGLPSPSVKESEERVRAAIRRSGFDWSRRRITVNLAPADIKKEGSALDLPIALGILAASGEVIPDSLKGWLILGELSLDGTVRPIRGALNYSILARERKISKMILPFENAREAALCHDVDVFAAKTLSEAISILKDGGKPVEPTEFVEEEKNEFDFSEVRGLESQRRAVLIAAAGGHNILMIGPPGSGKTMISRRIPSILPNLTFDEAIEMLRVHSSAGLTKDGVISMRPSFRAPHHSISSVGLIGGGNPLRPGEISIAHRGILFLDEFPEFRRELLEALRQPLEDGYVTVTRARGSSKFPTRFMLVAAMNPCPCGHLGSQLPCTCAPSAVMKYHQRISGPLLDRIDIHLEVPRRPFAETSAKEDGESSASMRETVTAARKRQLIRYSKLKDKTNASISGKALRAVAKLKPSARTLLENAVDKLELSTRAAEKITRIALTIADLDNREIINDFDIAEAVGYRLLDRRYLSA